jgi:hypothetical protein
MERCWHEKFTGSGRCPEAGRYGNPDYRPDGCRPGLTWSVRFMQASRWCFAHKHPGDRLLAPDDDVAAAPVEAGRPPEESLTP